MTPFPPISLTVKFVLATLLVCLCGCEAKLRIGREEIRTNDTAWRDTFEITKTPATNATVTKRQTMPPGWRLLCNDAGKFGVGYPSGIDGVNQFATKQEVIDWAWAIEAVRLPEIPPWKPCQ